jgi:hypothetical protein
MKLKPNNNHHTGGVLLHPAPRKQNRGTRVNAMLLVFFLIIETLVHYEFTPEDHTIRIFIW